MALPRFWWMPLRWAILFASALVVFGLVSFGYLYLATTGGERERIDESVLRELAASSAGSSSLANATHINGVLAADEHRTRFAAVYDRTGRRLAGNLARVPPGLALDGAVHETVGVRENERGTKVETMRAAARRLADGGVVVIGNDLDEFDAARHDLTVAIVAGLIPAFGVALVLGSIFGAASQRRVARIESAIERIAAGDFTRRLPVASGRGDIDRIALGVNRMLDTIETLIEEIRGLGDDMAHDLRTPLGRVRAQLERGRATATTANEFRLAIDRAIGGLDAALAVIVAILRIGQIEHRARRSGFARVDLAALVRDVADLYGPIAEDASVDLATAADTPATIDGDRELLFEALANLVDNAIKFTPPGGHVVIRTVVATDGITVSVADDGPGIPAAERTAVLTRFTRGDKSRHITGNGLGLSLVAAIARLHGSALTIGDAYPGCTATLAFTPLEAVPAVPARAFAPRA